MKLHGLWEYKGLTMDAYEKETMMDLTTGFIVGCLMTFTAFILIMDNTFWKEEQRVVDQYCSTKYETSVKEYNKCKINTAVKLLGEELH